MIACVRITHFAAIVEAEHHPALASHPLLITRATRGRAKVVAVSAAAERQGADAGMLLSRARAICPDAIVIPAAPDRWRRALSGVMERLTLYSQYVDAEREIAQTAVTYLDLGKLRPSDGLSLGRAMRAALNEQGFAAAVGLASSKSAANVAALLTKDVQLVPRGEEAAFLATQSINVLPLEAETARRLELLGFAHIGQLAALPPGALAAQFGGEGERLARLARGVDARHVGKFVPEVNERALRTFEPPLEDGQIVERVLVGLVTEMSARLKAGALSCRELTLTLRFDDGGSADITRKLREPLNDASALQRLARSLLGRLTISKPLSEIEFAAGRLAPLLPRQMSLFGEVGGEDVRIKVIDVAARYGDDRAYEVALVEPRYALPELGYRLERLGTA